MREAFRCLDGREVLLELDEYALCVTASTRAGIRIGRWQFELVDVPGHDILPIEDTGEPAAIKVAEASLDPAWTKQGIEERVSRLMGEETDLPVQEA